MCKSRTLSGKNTESVDATTTKAGISVNTRRTLFKAQMHEVRHDERRFDKRQSHQEDQHYCQRELNVRQENFHSGQNQQPDPNRQCQLAGQSVRFRMCAQELPPEYVFRVQALACANRRSQPPEGGTLSQLVHLNRQQIDQRKDKHPDQIHEVPVQTANFDVLGTIFAS